MDKKTYYVAVSADETPEPLQEGSYEFEIEATEAEIEELQQMFEAAGTPLPAVAGASALPGSIQPAVVQEADSLGMRDVYRMLHRLGSEATRRQIESLNVLPED